MVKEFFRNILNGSQNLENIFNFFLHFFGLLQIEVDEIVFVENDMSFSIQFAKLTQKLSICKFFSKFIFGRVLLNAYRYLDVGDVATEWFFLSVGVLTSRNH